MDFSKVQKNMALVDEILKKKDSSQNTCDRKKRPESREGTVIENLAKLKNVANFVEQFSPPLVGDL